MLQEATTKEKKKVDFSNLKIAFASYKDKQLKFAFQIFKFINYPSLVKFFSWLTLIGLKLGLPINFIIKSTIFRQFCGGETIEESKKTVIQLGKYGVKSILDFSAEGKQREKDFDNTKDEMLKILETAVDFPDIPFTSIKLTAIVRLSLLEKMSAGTALLTDETQEWERSKARLDEICKVAYVKHVALYIDAEETWIQQAIDDLSEAMMKKYNQQKAVVSTTLQMYRWDRIDYLNRLINDARKDNYILGIKLVRGAYWEKENERAKEKEYKTPMHQIKADTDSDYNKALDICMENIDKVALCNGTHNEESCMHLINLIDKYELPFNHPHVWFSQLKGMSDHISYNLGDAGYNVTKYLPYGPISSVTPYLLRRAEENTAIAGQMGRELKFIIAEKARRKRENS